MKSTGVLRKVDELGRIVIPIGLRKVYDIKEKDPIEIFVVKDQIVLRKYTHHDECVVTGQVTPQNREYVKGVVLSPRGAEILKQQIEFRFGIKA
ncbi:AbrB/MazE/SpoVT family DNA-binding domain-containing protein [Priestia megaterium]|uniref:AbrB/MazE/SpoVT family DNA-binding domain-containing protein n=1 Tax=Priestia megaterium TaxID=1404 RepID=UPI0036703FAA